MAAPKTTRNAQNRARKQAIKLNNLFGDTYDNISQSVYGTTRDNSDELNKMDKLIDDIISKELSDTKSITSDDMSTFLVKALNDMDRNNIGDRGLKDLNDVFEQDSSGLFQFFQERYRNKNLLYEDLNVITSQLFELSEAINTTRDSIITADDISKTISRRLDFLDSDVDGQNQSYIKLIEKIENDLKLPTKLKNLVIPYSLMYGQYYVYVCPYSKLFERQYINKMRDARYSGTSVKESADDNYVISLKDKIDKNFGREYLSEATTVVKKDSLISESKIQDSVKNYASNITIYNDEMSIPLLEGSDIMDLMDSDKFNMRVKKETKGSTKPKNIYGDGVVDVSKVKGTFDEFTGCYLKFIDPRKVIPVKILDETIGYYYIHESDFVINKSPFSTTIRVTNSTNNFSNNNELDNMFLSKMVDNIVQQFDKTYLQKNAKFKELILNALTYNDLYKKQIKFQFIPKDYMVEFKVNEDENGDGQSVLDKSLFYAKLYLALLIFKMITIITKSNDTKIYYVKNSGLEQNVTNKIQEVARSVRSRQINFMDLLNYNSIISKIGANKEIFMPVGRSGDRGIEFDILSGQDVQLNTDLMEMLRTNMINGTGVPSVIMNYINEADYAKTLVMANSKYVGRVVSYQIDYNPSITELYQKIMLYSGTSIPVEKIKAFQYTLNAPKTLNTSNLNDLIGSVDNIIATAIKALTGENGEQTEDINVIKDIMFNKLIREYVTGVDWDHVTEIYNEAKLEVEKRKMDKPSDNNE